jgi:hypothetical protein
MHRTDLGNKKGMSLQYYLNLKKILCSVGKKNMAKNGFLPFGQTKLIAKWDEGESIF